MSVVIRDKGFMVVSTSKNLRGILEYTRKHGVERVDIWPHEKGSAQFGITWVDEASCISDFADASVCIDFFMSRPRFQPWVILHPLKRIQQRPMTAGMVTCTQDEWADRMSDVRTYQTEEQFRNGYAVMYSRLSKTGSPVGEVHYLPNGEREYFTWPV